MASKIAAYDISSSKDEDTAQEEAFQQTLAKRVRWDQLEEDQYVELLSDDHQETCYQLQSLQQSQTMENKKKKKEKKQKKKI